MRTARINFIVEADEPALFFESKAAAESSLESIDVEDGIYAMAFDRMGVIYDVTARGKQVLLLRRPDTPPDPERLKATLQRFLTATNNDLSHSETLAQLLAKCEAYLGPPARWPSRPT
jgi:hypothetical protein